MKQSTKNLFTVAAIAMALLGTGPAIAAEDGLPTRAATLLGDYIAQQGNAALVQIREDLKKDLKEKIKPFLPAHYKATASTAAPGLPVNQSLTP